MNGNKNLNKMATRSIPIRIWLIWGCGALFYFYQFILRSSYSVMTDHLMHAFNVQACALGVLSAFYYNAYSAMQVPVGVMIDRFGPRRLMTVAVILCVIGTALFASAHDVKMASFGRFLMGVGSAVAYVGTLKIATLWFPRNHMGLAVGLTMIFGTMGGVSSGAPLGFWIEHMEWRQVMMILALVGLLLGLAIWMLVRDRPSELGLAEQTNIEYVSVHFWDGVLQVIASPQAWLMGFYACLMYLPLSVFVDLWGTPFVTEIYHIDRKISASAVSMILVGAAIGSPITAYLSDRWQNRKKFMVVSALGSILIYSIVIYMPFVPLPVMYGLLLFGGLFFTGQILSFVSVTEIMPVSASGVALGFINMIAMLSGVIFQPFVSWLLEVSWHKTGGLYIGQLPFYSTDNFRWALAPIPLGLVIALVLTKFIKETYPKKILSQ